MKEFAMAVSACDANCGWFKTCCMVPHLIIIPRMGGIKISAKNIITAVKYTPYLAAFTDDSLSIVFMILALDNGLSPGFPFLSIKFCSFLIRAFS